MMWKLKSPSIDDIEQDMHDAFTYKIAKPPKYAINTQEIESIKNIYNEYDAVYGRPTENLKGHNLSKELRKAMETAYEEVQENGRLKHLREQLKLAPLHCPMCGFGSIAELDHHLPKSSYQPLAIYPRNLIPSCGPCNKKKYTVAAEEPTKQFLHAYLEQLPAEVFFFADVDLASDGSLSVEFKIHRSPSMTEELASRLSFQIGRLGLNERYEKEINTYLGSLEVSLRDSYGTEQDAEGLRKYLQKAVLSHEIRFGKNDWRTALLRGLSQCDQFCNGGFLSALGILQPGA